MATEGLTPRSAVLRAALERGNSTGHAATGMLSVTEACERLGIGKSTLYLLIRDNKLESIKVRRRRLISPKAIERFIEQHEKEEAVA